MAENRCIKLEEETWNLKFTFGSCLQEDLFALQQNQYKQKKLKPFIRNNTFAKKNFNKIIFQTCKMVLISDTIFLLDYGGTKKICIPTTEKT